MFKIISDSVIMCDKMQNIQSINTIGSFLLAISVKSCLEYFVLFIETLRLFTSLSLFQIYLTNDVVTTS